MYLFSLELFNILYEKYAMSYIVCNIRDYLIRELFALNSVTEKIYINIFVR